MAENKAELQKLLLRALTLLNDAPEPVAPPPAQLPPAPALDPFEPLLVKPLRRAFAMLSVGNTRGHELIKEGTLVRVKLGARSAGITMESLRRAAQPRTT